MSLSCWQVHAAQVNVTVNDTDGKPVGDAVVYLLPPAGSVLPKPRDAQIDQKDRTFVPTVSVIQTGTSVSFPNSDNIRHQVYSFSPAKPFNLKLYSGKAAAPVVFDKPGAVVLGCNIHDQMAAWVFVVDTPWFGKSDANGKVSIKNLPDAGYELRIWHPGQRREADKSTLNVSGDVNKVVVIDAAPITGMHTHTEH
ncbi:MAG: methylamine utilization protein [Steroidobacteraceae bacterium]